MFLVGDIAVKFPLLLGSRLKDLVPDFQLALLTSASVSSRHPLEEIHPLLSCCGMQARFYFAGVLVAFQLCIVVVVV